MAMHINTLLYASIALALPITLLTLYLISTRFDWQTYRVAVDVGRAGSDEGAESDGDLSDLTITPTETESGQGPRPGTDGVRGWVRRNLYTYYRRN